MNSGLTEWPEAKPRPPWRKKLAAMVGRCNLLLNSANNVVSINIENTARILKAMEDSGKQC
jgi:hypothetical protein